MIFDPKPPSDPFAAPNIHTVTQLTDNIRKLLEQTFAMVWVTGELSNLRIPGSGHAYFNLKDDHSLIQSVMFRGQQQRLKFRLQDGLTVTGLGRISVYPPRGTYQIIFEFIEPKGAGALQLAFEQLKNRLDEKGLFDEEHKKPLPFVPHRVAFLTSASGAVLQDMLYMARQRFEEIPILLIPTMVQGPQAETQIVDALRIADQQTNCDVAILARGGGSLEDLQAFNSEAVANAIFKANIPVVSAVGHETDYTIADFVADLRAPTPTAAAETVFPDKNALEIHLQRLRKNLKDQLGRQLKYAQQNLNSLISRLKSPLRQLDRFKLRLDELNQRMSSTVQNRGARFRTDLNGWQQRLGLQSPEIRHKFNKQILKENYYKLIKYQQNILDIKRVELRLANQGLMAYGPQQVLKRGYSITRHPQTHAVIKDATEIGEQEPVEIILHKGRLKSIVTERTLEDGQAQKF